MGARRLTPAVVWSIVAAGVLAGALVGALVGGALGSGEAEQPAAPSSTAQLGRTTQSDFQARLPAAVRELNRARREDRRQIAGTHSGRERAVAALQLQSAYRRALRTLAPEQGEPVPAAVGALRRTAAAYGRLATAARSGKPRAYARAARAVGAHERRLRELLTLAGQVTTVS
jgi:hypothetical protein